MKSNSLSDFITDLGNTIKSNRGIIGTVDVQNFASCVTLSDTINISSVNSSTITCSEYGFKNLVLSRDSNLTASNIKRGHNIFGIQGNGATILDYNLESYMNKTLTEVNLLEYSTLGYGAFISQSNLTSVANAHNIISVGDCAFQYCDNLQSISFSSNLTYLGSRAFYQCSNLKDVNISNTNISVINGSTFFYNNSLSNIVLPRTLESIGSYAFYSCKSIASITIPSNVTTIKDSVFYRCGGLSSVVFENISNLKYVGDYAFSSCSSTLYSTISSVVYLSKIALSTSGTFTSADTCYISDGTEIIAYRCMQGASFGTVVLPSTIRNINTFAFAGCRSLSRINLESTKISEIETYAFMNCSALSSINMPSTVTSIGYGALSGCTLLSDISLNSIEYIENSAFYNCSNLFSSTDTLVLPDSLLAIGSGAFANCPNISNIIVNSNLQEIRGYNIVGKMYAYNINTVTYNAISCKYVDTNSLYSSFGPLFGFSVQSVIIGSNVTCLPAGFMYGASISSINVPSTVTSVGELAFASCQNLTSINLSNVTSLCSQAFSNCSNISKIILNNISRIESLTFASCKNLSSVTGIDDVEYIGYGAFSGCSKLSSFNFTSKLSYIDNFAFYSCASLEADLNKLSNVSYIGSYAFYYCYNLSGSINLQNISYIGSYAFERCTMLTGVLISDINKWCNITFDNMYANPLYYAQKLYLNGSLITSISFPYGTSIVKSHILCRCNHISEVIMPDTVTNIGIYAFSGCYNLSSVTLGSNVIVIDAMAFNKCDNLISINLPDTIVRVGGGAFSSCSKLTSVTNISRLTSIGDYAFADCSALSGVLSLNESLNELSLYAFYGCSNLTMLSFPSTIRTLGECALAGVNVSIHNLNLENVISCGEYAIQDSPNITGTLTLPNSSRVKFGNLSNVTSVVLNSNIQTLGLLGFSGLTSSLILPSTISSALLTNMPNVNYIEYSGIGYSDWYQDYLRLSNVCNDSYYTANNATLSAPNVVALTASAFSNCKFRSYYLGQNYHSVIYLSRALSGTLGLYESYLGYYASIYVPSLLYNRYITASYWSDLSARIVGV